MDGRHIAAELGMHPSTLYRKLRNPRLLYVDDALELSHLLHILGGPADLTADWFRIE